MKIENRNENIWWRSPPSNPIVKLESKNKNKYENKNENIWWIAPSPSNLIIK